ncbi:NAD(P)H-dependent oxidoreductase [Streptomyces sp. 8K308]|uniref:NAD(P)H-dependent oxidoreductase n=1 Tax=Streptomyces sp. 8K308 TaxID=2530388 RepID=UPI001FB83D3E|nr:NAD(P)H-dependent oxidoreductase [Streptomyces sp. 8K308]
MQNADAAILAVPLYNYGASQHFKTWVDLVITGAGPNTPLLKGTPPCWSPPWAAATDPAPRGRAGTTPLPTWSGSWPTSGRPS